MSNIEIMFYREVRRSRNPKFDPERERLLEFARFRSEIVEPLRYNKNGLK